MKISFIIPTFNSKVNFLKRCVLSVIEQESFDLDFEIIIVNDGSTEKNLLLYLDDLKLIDRVKVINKINGGVSSARNVGLGAASGNYICFVDADDFISKKFFITIKKYLFNENDIIYFKNYVTYKTIVKKRNKNFSNNTVWGKLIKKSIIVENGIAFDENLKYCEDTIFMQTLRNVTNSFAFIDDYLYAYCLNNFNTTNSYSPNSYLDFNQSLNLLKKDMSPNDFNLLCLIFFLKFILPKCVYNKKFKVNKKKKKELSIALMNDKKMYFYNIYNINVKQINKFRKIEVNLLKKYHFEFAMFINKLSELIKFCLGRFS